ncbi:MAG: exosortase H-associated membrane protein [Nitrospirota bacterium]
MKNTELTDIMRRDSVIYIKFTPLTMKNALLSAKVDKSHYTFNVPLTLSVLASLFPFIQRRLRACIECLLMLFTVHFIYIFFLATLLLTVLYMDRGIEAVSEFRLAAYKFLWGFSGRMLLRVAPFLIGVYIFLRFRKAESR